MLIPNAEVLVDEAEANLGVAIIVLARALSRAAIREEEKEEEGKEKGRQLKLDTVPRC